MKTLSVRNALVNLLRVIDEAALNRGGGTGYLTDSADLAREALAANGNDEGEVASNLSAGQIDEHLDAILRASGSALRHYSMEKTMTDMRTAVKGLANAAVMAHVGLSDGGVCC